MLYLLGDDRIARTQGGTTHYLHTDGLGSTRLLTTSTGQGADRWWYEAFGEVESQTGSSDNAFLFAGEQLDPNLGHYYLRARYMDPANGRFTQMDLWEGMENDSLSLHKYMYANASPQLYTDRTGYMSAPEMGAASNALNATLSISLPSMTSLVTGISASLLFAVGTDALITSSIVYNSKAKDEARERLRDVVLESVRRRSGDDPLYYYTTEQKAKTFFAEQGKMCGDKYKGRLGVLTSYPAGIYATDIAPWDPFTTNRMLAILFYGGNQGKDVSWFAAIDGSEFYELPGGERQWVRQCEIGQYVPVDVCYIGPGLLDP